MNFVEHFRFPRKTCPHLPHTVKKGVQKMTVATDTENDGDDDVAITTNIRQDTPQLYGIDVQQQMLIDIFNRQVVREDEDDDDDDDDGDDEQTTDHSSPELTIITGKSGTGKSSLAKTLAGRTELFLYGKCDQLHQESASSEPLKPFLSVLGQLTDHVLRQTDEATSRHYKEKVQELFHESTEINLLIDLAPELAGFFPNHKLACQRSNNNNSNRNISTTATPTTTTKKKSIHHPKGENPTIKLVCEFLFSFCSVDQPLVILIDDVQWIDSISLQLLEELASRSNVGKKNRGFMLLVTCRDDEVTVNDPISETLRDLEGNRGVTINEIKLGNLPIEAVCNLVNDRFPTLSGHGLETLSDVMYKHTKGHAFFVTQMLHRLEDSGWKAPEQNKHGNDDGGPEEIDKWNFDDERSMVDMLMALDCDALVHLIVGDTANAKPIMKEVLIASSCLGADFATSHVLAVVDGHKDEVLECLGLLEEHELIGPHHGRIQWSWTHDKFQKAAYLLMDTKDRQKFHLSVGRRLLSKLQDDELQQHLFIVAGQFGISLKLLDDDDEKETIAVLMLRAGARAGTSSSFNAAASYFAMGTYLLKSDNWSSQYDLSIQLYNAAAEMECCRGRFDESDKLVNVILRHSQSLEDRVRASETKLYSLVARQQSTEAVCLALEMFDQLGERLPRKPGLPKIAYEVFSTKMLMSKKSEDDILNLPPLRDWKKLATFRILQLVFPAMLRAAPELAPIISCRCVKLTLRHGICAMSCAPFATMGMVLIHPLGFIEEGTRYVQIGQRILEAYDFEEIKCRFLLVLGAFCQPYTRPVKESMEPLERGGSIGLLTGDLDMACVCLQSHALFAFYWGWQLDKVMSLTCNRIKKFRAWDRQFHVPLALHQAQMLESFVDVTKDDPCIFTGPNWMNENEWMEKSKVVRDEAEIMIFWMNKSLVATYLGEYERAKEYVDVLMKQKLESATPVHMFQIHFLNALINLIFVSSSSSESTAVLEDHEATATATAETSGGRQRLRRCGIIATAATAKRRQRGTATKRYKSSLSKLQFYAKYTPENVTNKICLIEAEYAVLRNDKLCALSKFKQSIDAAHRQGLVHEQALAYERCAIALLGWSKRNKNNKNNNGDHYNTTSNNHNDHMMTESLEFFDKARTYYQYWGSPVKVKRLEAYIQEKCNVKNISWREK